MLWVCADLIRGQNVFEAPKSDPSTCVPAVTKRFFSFGKSRPRWIMMSVHFKQQMFKIAGMCLPVDASAVKVWTSYFPGRKASYSQTILMMEMMDTVPILTMLFLDFSLCACLEPLCSLWYYRNGKDGANSF